VSGGVVGTRNEYDLLVGAHHRLDLAVERRTCRPDQHQSVLALDRLQRLRQLLLQSLRICLRTKVKKTIRIARQHGLISKTVMYGTC